MNDFTGNADAFLKYGPLGFSAFVLLAAIFALMSGGTEKRDGTLRLIIWVAFFVFCISAVLAFIPQYFRRDVPAMTAAQAEEIRSAVQQTLQAIEQVKQIPTMVSGSCSGGPNGINPKNYESVAKIANEATARLATVTSALQSALTLAPPAEAKPK